MVKSKHEHNQKKGGKQGENRHIASYKMGHLKIATMIFNIFYAEMELLFDNNLKYYGDFGSPRERYARFQLVIIRSDHILFY